MALDWTKLLQLAGGGAEALSGLNPVTAAIGAVPELFKAGLGIAQGIKAKQIAKNTVRPQYSAPNAFLEALSMAEMRALDPNLPGQGMIENKLGADLSNTIRGIQEMGGSSGERLAAMSAASDNKMNATLDLGVQAANNRLANERALQAALGRAADYQDRAWEWNKKQPYEDAVAKAAALNEGFNSNLYGALKGLGGAAASTIGTNQSNNPQTSVVPGNVANFSFKKPGSMLNDDEDATLSNLLTSFGQITMPAPLPNQLMEPYMMPPNDNRNETVIDGMLGPQSRINRGTLEYNLPGGNNPDDILANIYDKLFKKK